MAHAVIGDKFRQLVHFADRPWEFFLSRRRLGSISNAPTISNPSFSEAAIGDQGQAQVAHPHEHHRLKSGSAQLAGDLWRIIRRRHNRGRGCPKLPKRARSLRNWVDFHPGGFGQGLAGHGADAVFPGGARGSGDKLKGRKLVFRGITGRPLRFIGGKLKATLICWASVCENISQEFCCRPGGDRRLF